MKKYIIFSLLIVLFIAGCVSKARYYDTISNYTDTLSRVRATLKAQKEDNETLAQGVMLLRKQAETHKKMIQMYQDSLTSLQLNLRVLAGDTNAWRYLTQENQSLKTHLSRAIADNQSLNGQINYLESLNKNYPAQIQILKDSLEMLNSLIKSSYATTFNFTKQIKSYDNTFDCYIVNVQKSKLHFFWKNKKGDKYLSFKNLLYDLHKENQTLLFATNAGMFTPRNTPQGLYVEKGEKLIPLDLSKQGDGNFYMKPNGVFIINSEGNAYVKSSEEFAQCKDSILYATQSGPMLLHQGKIHPSFTKGSENKYIRSGVGIISPHKIVFVISREPVNFYDFASLFKDYFQCSEALYLDGAISKMFLPEIGRFDMEGDFGPMIGILK
jgi:uncharacterized protein YigE (DUF2233 family)